MTAMAHRRPLILVGRPVLCTGSGEWGCKYALIWCNSKSWRRTLQFFFAIRIFPAYGIQGNRGTWGLFHELFLTTVPYQLEGVLRSEDISRWLLCLLVSNKGFFHQLETETQLVVARFCFLGLLRPHFPHYIVCTPKRRSSVPLFLRSYNPRTEYQLLGRHLRESRTIDLTRRSHRI